MNYQEFHTEIDATYRELRFRTNELAHKMATQVHVQDYIDQVAIDPSRKYAICSDNYSYTPRPRISGPVAPNQPNKNGPASPANERGEQFMQHAAKVKAKARALAELRLEEMDVREQHIQLKLGRIQAKREILELDADEV